MSGGVAAVGVIAVTATLSLATVGLGAGLLERQRVVAAADSAALAAADTASGALAGEPCAAAAEVARANGAELADCTVDGASATVTARGSFAGIPLIARARAGPPSTPAAGRGASRAEST
ncbi:Rv3654c family TadE-like protein [Schumannella sp. 10F1B-5-1]|uniref:Rv3654c family TadE-like protein n=1 Tax=Schumannella sp. 10F1B-5-1 TaxID=2590780 RepID=UPI00112FDF7A|nr:Rv3654c family TadE-like protein [Schumannella sp. 10F1B-5-1]TPW73476.1 helicase [Schumannella sp. 10F1B-5-1]